MPLHLISDEQLTLQTIATFLSGGVSVALSESSSRQISRCRAYLDEKLKTSTQPIYGINTGFGSLYNRNISSHQLETLQENLVKSHACGTGPEVPNDIVRLMLFLKIQSLAYGYSGVQLVTVQRLAEMLNHDVLPRVFEM
ncbi:MAG TPA: aromatic amino acid lyase, partial [Chryseolinea sp.]|nr:aromatic amino acid lyase [Chryseolinea sp.]